MDGLSNNLLANGLLAGFYVVYKILDRCMHSKCRYTKDNGFAFDLDPTDGEDCPATDMEKIADLLKSRALVYDRKGTSRV
jgi:hypothetical protein